MEKILYSALFLLCFASIIQVINAECRKKKECILTSDCPKKHLCIENENGQGFCHKCQCKKENQCVVVNSNNITCVCDEPNFTGEFCDCEIKENADISCKDNDVSYVKMEKHYFTGSWLKTYGFSNPRACEITCTSKTQCMMYFYREGYCSIATPQPYWRLISAIKETRADAILGFKKDCETQAEALEK